MKTWTAVAPDLALMPSTLCDGDHLQYDLDSMDFLNLVTALHKRTGMNVKGADYPHVRTITGALRYLQEAKLQT